MEHDGLWVGNSATTRKLRRLIAACADFTAANEPGGTIEVSYNARRSGLRIVVTPFAPARVGIDPARSDKPLALLLVHDPQQERHNLVMALRRRFNLTPAEAEFALQMIKGDGRAAAAA